LYEQVIPGKKKMKGNCPEPVNTVGTEQKKDLNLTGKVSNHGRALNQNLKNM
jgi:hypothetical protein